MTDYSGVMLKTETKALCSTIREGIPKSERVKSADDLVNWLIETSPQAQRILKEKRTSA